MAGLKPHQRDILMREGAIRGLKTLTDRREVSAQEADAVLKSVLGAMLREITEARKEIARLNAALGAMEAACRSGMAGGAAGRSVSADRFTESFITFDAWAVSLMETSLTIAGLLNPAHARKKISEFSTAMNALLDKRAAAGHPVMDDPSLFSGYVDR